MALSAAQRRKLSPAQFACPDSRSFPLDKPGRIRNAHARWHNPLTKNKCSGGHTRILKALCRIGASPSDASCPVR